MNIPKKILYVDLETYSEVDINISGLHKYVESSSFEILLFGYAYGNNPVQCVDLAQGGVIPPSVVRDLFSDDVKKVAQNASFEIACLRKKYGDELDYTQWCDLMVMAYYLSLPGPLEDYGKILGLDVQKQESRKMLIKYFCSPCTPTRVNSNRSRNYPQHDLDKWHLFMRYNVQDIIAERKAYLTMNRYTQNDDLWTDWCLDQNINDRGICIDTKLIDNAIAFNTKKSEELLIEARELTGLDNPNNPAHFKKWLSKIEGEKINNMSNNTEVIRMLEIRSQLAKISTKKYVVMQSLIQRDGRCRNFLQFYGVSRTGRWSGKLHQILHLHTNNINDLDQVRELVRKGQYFALDSCYDNMPDILSQLVGSSFIPASGMKFIIANYSVIETRIIAWLAKEEWVNQVFKTTGLIYETTASKMFNVPIEEVTKELRIKGTAATLALRYQGTIGALKKMGITKTGIAEEDLKSIVAKWCKANPNIVKLWEDVEVCVKKSIQNPVKYIRLPQNYNVCFVTRNRVTAIILPSGRRLNYFNMSISSSGSIFYEGYAEGKSKAWGRVDIYGGKFVENIVQAIARDCLALALSRLEAHHYKVVMHMHDEVVIEATPDQKLDDVIKILGDEISWAKDLYLTVAGFESDYYKKDERSMI